jgi:hypothetical protein
LTTGKEKKEKGREKRAHRRQSLQPRSSQDTNDTGTSAVTDTPSGKPRARFADDPAPAGDGDTVDRKGSKKERKKTSRPNSRRAYPPNAAAEVAKHGLDVDYSSNDSDRGDSSSEQSFTSGSSDSSDPDGEMGQMFRDTAHVAKHQRESEEARRSSEDGKEPLVDISRLHEHGTATGLVQHGNPLSKHKPANGSAKPSASRFSYNMVDV